MELEQIFRTLAPVALCPGKQSYLRAAVLGKRDNFNLANEILPANGL